MLQGNTSDSVIQAAIASIPLKTANLRELIMPAAAVA